MFLHKNPVRDSLVKEEQKWSDDDVKTLKWPSSDSEGQSFPPSFTTSQDENDWLYFKISSYKSLNHS